MKIHCLCITLELGTLEFVQSLITVFNLYHSRTRTWTEMFSQIKWSCIHILTSGMPSLMPVHIMISTLNVCAA